MVPGARPAYSSEDNSFMCRKRFEGEMLVSPFFTAGELQLAACSTITNKRR
jgi:hypothetical protein